MKRNRLTLVLAATLLGSVALVGCKKKEEPAADTAPPPAATTPAPAPTTPEPAPAPAATVTVTAVDLGTEAGADKKIAKPTTTFTPKDKIVAAVATSSSDPATPASGKLGAKWTFQDGQVVNEESKDYSFSGQDVTDFEISKPDGWPAGKYKLEVSLDGNVVQTKDFEIK